MGKSMSTKTYKDQGCFWEYAGLVGYKRAIFSNELVANHIISKQCQTVVRVAELLKLNKNSIVIELGCGDGYFAENILSNCFSHVDAYDFSETAIAAARIRTQKISFYREDLATYDFVKDGAWDGAFLMGFLHHIKGYAPQVISRLAKVCPKVVVLEPNGDNMIRKLLEALPFYRKAGEDSFRLREIIKIFEENGYSLEVIYNINFIPPFLNKILFLPMKFLEQIIESHPFLNKLCATYVLGFKQGEANGNNK